MISLNATLWLPQKALVMISLRYILARFFLLAAFASAAGFAVSASRSDAPRTSLFAGGDLAAWTIEAIPADKDRGFITVQDGAIWAHASAPDKLSKDHVWLVTKKEYSDFVLSMKFQSVRGDRGNSGIQIRGRIDENGVMQGPQLDLNPPGPWRTGMLYDITEGVARFLSPARPASEVKEALAAPGLIHYFSDEGPGWNEIEITAIGPHLKGVLNGITVMDFVDTENVLKDSIHQKYDVGVKGFIAMQVHSGKPLDMKFKDIKIQDLSVDGEMSEARALRPDLPTHYIAGDSIAGLNTLHPNPLAPYFTPLARK